MAESHKLGQRIAAGLEDKVSAFVRQMVTQVQGPLIQGMIQKFNQYGPELRPRKEYSIDNLEKLVGQAVSKLEENGFKVFRAKTSREAVDYVLNLAEDGIVVKSKSNAVKEIGLMEALEQNGVTVVETDLGDRICQMGNIPASHPIGPALHVPVQKVAELFARETGSPVPPIPEEIVKIGRETLRNKFFKASIGLSGANAIAADTGSVVLMENEGNIRCVTNLPPVHIIVAGVEKIVPTLEDGIRVVRAAALFGMGLDIGTYVSVISGPSRTSTIEGKIAFGLQGPGEVHLVLLEEGRWEAISEGFGESLYCINCGSCLGRCPVYGELGENYGYKYFGGIGVIHTAFRNGTEKAREAGLPLCVGCQKCIASCPVSINTPGMIRRLRSRVVDKHGLDVPKKFILRHFLNNGSIIQGISPLIGNLICDRDGKGGWYLRYPLAGLEKDRRLPELSGRTFLNSLPVTVGRGKKKVAYFAGCLNNTVFPRVAGATVQVLKEVSSRVVIPAGQKCCGYPSLASGDREYAIINAMANINAFASSGVDTVVTDCATCYSGLLGYPELLAGNSQWEERAREFSAKVKDLSQFLLEAGFEPEYRGKRCKVTYHQPCHLAAHGLNQGVQLLQSMPGIEFVPSHSGEKCCGFGGIFNLDFYNLSRAIGERRIGPIVDSGAGVVATSCPGCMVQLMDGMAKKDRPVVLHISELLAGGGGSIG